MKRVILGVSITGLFTVPCIAGIMDNPKNDIWITGAILLAVIILFGSFALWAQSEPQKEKVPRETAISTENKDNNSIYILDQKGGKVNDGTNSASRRKRDCEPYGDCL